jgi:membrane fusion protein (multidrug efflux system)
LNSRVRIGIAAAVVIVIGVAAWFFLTRDRESTDDAQIDGHLSQIAPRVGGTVLKVNVTDNQQVKAGDLLVEIDPRDYQIAVDKARADLSQAQADAEAARQGVPIASTQTRNTTAGARGGVEQAQGALEANERELEAAKARLVTVQARQREAEANAAKSGKDVERLRGLLAKDEVSQMQFDAAVATADAQKAAVDSTRSQIIEAQAGIRVADSRVMQAHAAVDQAQSELRATAAGPEQVLATRAKAESAEAHAAQLKAALAQAELNLQYATVRAPIAGIVSRKSVEVGQTVQAGQPLLALISLDDLWVTANFKETQLTDMRAGQRATIDVDAYGHELKGHVDSIAAATGARFSLLPPENATGNFVKVVQRVPVKIVLEPGQDPEHRLRPGLSVTPTVYVK